MRRRCLRSDWRLSLIHISAPLIKKVYIPKYIFPLERVCFALVNCLFSFIALVIGDVDGGLIGGASLKAADFSVIVDAAK